VAYSWWRAAAAAAREGNRTEAARAARAGYEIASAIGWTTVRDGIAELARRARLDINVPDDIAPSAAERYGLTGRELEVLALVAEGATNRQIADALFISVKTASVHVSNILGKLGVANRGEAAAAARRLGLDLAPASPAAAGWEEEPLRSAPWVHESRSSAAVRITGHRTCSRISPTRRR
jgi:DNA-binding CsgD family transcriptional regulator